MVLRSIASAFISKFFLCGFYVFLNFPCNCENPVLLGEDQISPEEQVSSGVMFISVSVVSLLTISHSCFFFLLYCKCLEGLFKSIPGLFPDSVRQGIWISCKTSSWSPCWWSVDILNSTAADSPNIALPIAWLFSTFYWNVILSPDWPFLFSHSLYSQGKGRNERNGQCNLPVFLERIDLFLWRSCGSHTILTRQFLSWKIKRFVYANFLLISWRLGKNISSKPNEQMLAWFVALNLNPLLELKIENNKCNKCQTLILCTLSSSWVLNFAVQPVLLQWEFTGIDGRLLSSR